MYRIFFYNAKSILIESEVKLNELLHKLNIKDGSFGYHRLLLDNIKASGFVYTSGKNLYICIADCNCLHRLDSYLSTSSELSLTEISKRFDAKIKRELTLTSILNV